MDEKQLVLLAGGGDKDAFCALYSLYKDKLYRYAFYRLKSKEDAEDAVSEAVISAFQQIGSLKKAEAFSAWIFRILYCSCNSIIKTNVNKRKLIEINSQGETVSDFKDEIVKTELIEALESLKEEEREIVLLSVVSGLSSKEIAKICDLTSGAVRSKLSRSLSKMRKFLGD
ncbi:MAG: RNA polymerase sigma factor [Eubacterium sp.]|nr:RNA polymerase sigma factor [Eubacterium sp.]